MKKVTVGMIGTGFAAALHAEAYQKVYGIEVCVKAAASLAPDAEAFARRYGIGQVYPDYRRLLEDPEIEVIDIISPPYLHREMIEEALKSGKHVICEKPLTGFFCRPGEEYADGCPRKDMYEAVCGETRQLRQAIRQSGRLFMYAENYIYTPALQKSLEFIRAQKSRILFLRAEESHKGSHAMHAARWKYNGGGSLIRQGCHPLSAVLYIKDQESRMRGEDIRVTGVMAEVARTGAGLSPEEHAYIDSHAVDVEDLANVIVTFSDQSQAVVMAGDMVVGGVRNLVEIYTNESVYHCNMAATDGLRAYHEREKGIEDFYITEKLGCRTGWQNIYLEEELMRGYSGEIQEFMECAAFGGTPQSDFELAARTIELTYAAYQSAQEGRRIALNL